MPREPTERYVAEIDTSEVTGKLCKCGDCGNYELGENLKPIEDCGLSPGDPSPAGRCSECGSISYVTGKKINAC